MVISVSSMEMVRPESRLPGHSEPSASEQLAKGLLNQWFLIIVMVPALVPLSQVWMAGDPELVHPYLLASLISFSRSNVVRCDSATKAAS